MFERRSLKFPITLGVTMIVVLVVLIVGWVLLAVFGAMRESDSAPVYWTVLTIGSALFILVLVGVVIYLVLTIKVFNLNRRQSNFVDSVTHELKSPIASLKLYLQTLSRRQVTDAEREDFMRFMLDDVERLDVLITHLLAAGNIDKKPDEEFNEQIDLKTLITEITESVCLRYRIDQNVVELDLQPCIVESRRFDIDMIFRNLIDNAVKYAGAQPSVKIELQAQGENIEARITDNGRGIPKEMRRKVFSRFVRLGSELERDKPGTGLGLYIVRTLVSKLGGKVRVSDSAGETGTVFELTLPLAQVSDRRVKRQPSTSTPLEVASQ